MSWYRSGTVTAAAGQNVITGTGTQWANNVMGVAPGQAFIVQRANGNTLIYEILAVDSNTRIRINGNVVDALVASNYGIQTSVSNSYSALARETSAQLALYQKLLEDWQDITTGTGDVTIIAPDGTEVVIPALSWISDSKTWFDTNKALIENAGKAVAGAGVARDQAVAANTAAQSAKTAAAGSASTASTAATTATGAVSTATTAKNDAVAANTSAQAAKNAAEAAAASVNLPPLGIGLPNMTDIANFDWQNFVFTAGANYVTSYNTWVNPPAGITYNAGTRVSIRVIYISTTNGPRMGLELTPDTGSSTNFKVYKLLCVGAAGSRVFTFNQDWNSANAVPITGGGTGATTLEGAKAALGIVPQLFTIIYPDGTQAAPYNFPANTRKEYANPFAGRSVLVVAEVLYNSIWGPTGWIYNPTNQDSVGILASQINGTGSIIVQSGKYGVISPSNFSGSPHQITGTASFVSAPFRLVISTKD